MFSLSPCDFLSHWSIFQSTRHHKGWFQREYEKKEGNKKKVTKTQQMLNSWWLFTSLFSSLWLESWCHIHRNTISNGFWMLRFVSRLSFETHSTEKMVTWYALRCVHVNRNIKSWHPHRHLTILISRINRDECWASCACGFLLIWSIAALCGKIKIK